LHLSLFCILLRLLSPSSPAFSFTTPISAEAYSLPPLPPLENPWVIWPPLLDHVLCRPKIYIYPTPAHLTFTPQEEDNCANGNYNYASEKILLDVLQDSSRPFHRLYVTDKPEEATLFYIPFRGSCYLHQCWRSHDWNWDERCDVEDYYVKPWFDYIINEFPYWNRTHGKDHFMIHPMDQRDFYYKDMRMDNATYLVTNGDLRQAISENERFRFRRYRDLVIPSSSRPMNVLRVNVTEYVGELGNPDRRTVLAMFRGCCDDASPTDAYSHGVRFVLFSIANHPGFDVGARTDDGQYLGLLSRSMYGLAPEGWTLDSTRLWDYLAFGVVPVIISDGIVLPFEDDVDWRSMTIRVQRDEAHELEELLLGVSHKRWLKMQQRVWQVGRKLNLEEDAWHYIVRGLCRMYGWNRREIIQLEE